MTDTRLAILPLTGAGERECKQCRHLDAHEAPFAPSCQLTGYGLCSVEGRAQRDSECLSAERDAARLRAIEAAARAYFAADDALAEKMQESEHWGDIDAESARAGEALLALRAALKE